MGVGGCLLEKVVEWLDMSRWDWNGRITWANQIVLVCWRAPFRRRDKLIKMISLYIFLGEKIYRHVVPSLYEMAGSLQIICHFRKKKKEKKKNEKRSGKEEDWVGWISKASVIVKDDICRRRWRPIYAASNWGTARRRCSSCCRCSSNICCVCVYGKNPISQPSQSS